MRIDPEQVLEHDRVAALGRVEHAGADHPFSEQQCHGDTDDRGGENLDPGRGVERPGEKRDAHPGHPLGAQPVDGGHEIQPGEDRREAEQKHRDCCQRDIGAGLCGVGDIEGPAGIRRAAAGKQRDDRQERAADVQIPGEEIEFWKDHVARADLDRHDQVAEGRRDAGDNEQEDHDHPVQGEDGIVGLRTHDRLPRREQLEAQQQAEKHCETEEEDNAPEVEQADAFVVGRQKPVEDTGINPVA